MCAKKLLFALIPSLLGIVACLQNGSHLIGHRQPYGYILYPRKEDCHPRLRLHAGDSRVSAKAEERFYKMIVDKHAQVDQLLETHKDPTDRLQLRLNFVECTANHKLREMLQRHSTDKFHGLSVIADMKRRTPTHNPKCDNTILSYVDAAEVSKNMADAGFDVIFVNTDEISYGGHISELHKCFLELRKMGRRVRPAIVMKDIILHPIQIAQAAEYRADGVVLNASILGNALRNMIASCITMGIEAIVEVHTGTEALKALDMGASHLMVNQWDRVENILRPTRALEVKEIAGESATFIAAGGIVSYSQIHELGLIGYDAVVLGRRLMYNDIPEFVRKIKNWKAPCKGILRMSKSMFFDMSESDDDAGIKIKLKDDHHRLVNDMNAFYGNSCIDLSDLNQDHLSDPSLQQMASESSKEIPPQIDDPNNKDKVITVTCGNPINTTFVKNIFSTPESPDCMVDADEYFEKEKSEMYEMKWYIERRKWIRRFRHLFKTRDDAEKAHMLHKAIEMYTTFKMAGIEHMRKALPHRNVEHMEKVLTERVRKAYEEAPRDENGNVILPQ